METLHNFPIKLQKELQLLEADSSIRKENKTLIIDFINEQQMRGISEARRWRVLQFLRGAAKGQPYFKEWDKEKVKELAYAWETAGFTATTKATYQTIFKVFFKWLRQTETAPPEVAWFKAPKQSHALDPRLFLTADELQALIRCAPTIREKCLIAMLAESGARISELGILRFEDISFKAGDKDKRVYGITTILRGKTGERVVLLVDSLPYFLELRQNHPDPRPDNYLFLGRHGGKLTYNGINYMLRRAARKAGISKPINPHMFRKAVATKLCLNPMMSDGAVKRRMGWDMSTKVLKVYQHPADEDVNQQYLEAIGLKKKQSEIVQEKHPLTCASCGIVHAIGMEYCRSCGRPLSLEIALRDEEEQEAMIEQKIAAYFAKLAEKYEVRLRI